MTKGTAVVGRQDAADCRVVGERRIERQALAVTRERVVNVPQRGPPFDRRGEIAVLVLEDAIQPPCAEEGIDPLRRTSLIQLGAGAADDDRLPRI
jgi:hypothetical protein